LARATAEAGLAGFEWAISLPGTIGGAVRGNAGCFGGEVKDTCVSARVLSCVDGKWLVRELDREALAFKYRESSVKHSTDIVLSARFDLQQGKAEVLKAKLTETLTRRKATQPLSAGSAGCTFKNYEATDESELQRIGKKLDIFLPGEMMSSRRVSAGWLVDKLGLKGKKIGGAQISSEHGNFIINSEKATASDIVQLIALVKTRARNEVGIQLQEEVQILA
jgi:UDP-N-acetylmuramate dehydrogenase